jgi:hypothetical protein
MGRIMKYAVAMDSGAMIYSRIHKFREDYFIHSKVGEEGRYTDLQVAWKLHKQN